MLTGCLQCEISIPDFLELITSPGWSINCVKSERTQGYFSLRWKKFASDPSDGCQLWLCDSVMSSVSPQAGEMSFLTIPDMPGSSFWKLGCYVCVLRWYSYENNTNQSHVWSQMPSSLRLQCVYGWNGRAWTFLGNCKAVLRQMSWQMWTNWRKSWGKIQSDPEDSQFLVYFIWNPLKNLNFYSILAVSINIFYANIGILH